MLQRGSGRSNQKEGKSSQWEPLHESSGSAGLGSGGLRECAFKVSVTGRVKLEVVGS